MEIVTGPAKARVTFLFAHGAGAPMDSDFMNVIADGLSAQGIRVVRFEFPYMSERRKSGKVRAPDRAPKLLETFRERFAEERARLTKNQRLAIGGKSMGGRIASMIADEVSADALVCLGYPFWPPGKEEGRGKPSDRTTHLPKLTTPTLILQGTRDPFGTESEVKKLRLGKTVAWLPDGDHDLAPRRLSGRTHEENLATAINQAATFLLSQ